jgi:hypothetical protein
VHIFTFYSDQEKSTLRNKGDVTFVINPRKIDLEVYPNAKNPRFNSFTVRTNCVYVKFHVNLAISYLEEEKKCKLRVNYIYFRN